MPCGTNTNGGGRHFRSPVAAAIVLAAVLAVLPAAVGATQEVPPPDPATSAPSGTGEPAGTGAPAGAELGDPSSRLQDAEARAEQALAEPEDDEADTASAAPVAPVTEPPQMNILDLAYQGGVLMIPITLMSVLTVIFGLERWLGLRRRKVLPGSLITALGNMSEKQRGFDPKAAYRLCQQHPSAAANVIKAMLLKVGRPLTEVEHAMKEAGEREADRLYANVRFLSLAAAITPLLGLLGTVQGMIQAFFVTSHLPTGANRAELLAQGIYVALVTTFAGLCVAIPAGVLAHFFEGRIQKLFRELEETLMGVLPQLERFEGRLRVGADDLNLPPAPPVERPPREAAGDGPPSEGQRQVPAEEKRAGGAAWR